VRGRFQEVRASVCASCAAVLLLLLYLTWIASPALHQLHLHLESQEGLHHACPAADPDWRILSHPPDQPCSDPDHHHHPRPVHDEDHCLSCRPVAAAVALLPFVETAVHPPPLARTASSRIVLGPVCPALLTASPRAPPPHPTA
jgi:hypothetical protein